MQHGSNFQATPQRMLGTRSTPPPPAPQQAQMSHQSNRSQSPLNNGGQISSSMGSGTNPAAPLRGQLNQLMMGIIEHGAPQLAHANVNKQPSAVSSSMYNNTQSPY